MRPHQFAIDPIQATKGTRHFINVCTADGEANPLETIIATRKTLDSL